MKKHFLVLALLVFPLMLLSQILTPIKWSFQVNRISDEKVELVFKANIDKGWHLYSQFIPENGPIPTSFKFEKSPSYQLSGKLSEPKGIEEYDAMFEMKLKFFSDEAVFKQKIIILNDQAFKINGVLEFMCCDDKQCLPPEEVEFSFNIGKAAKPFAKAKGSQTDTSLIKPDSAVLSDSGAVGADTSLAVKPGVKTETSEGQENLWWFFLISFLAGLAAILTPCVFPMIPMTVTFFMHDKEKKNAKMQAIVYGISIILIYTVIGTIVAVTLGANFANFLSTHWIPNVFFFLIFVFFAASFLGMFEITLPSWLISKADKQADKGGYSGAFFMAFTLVLVSFSCTGPIVGAILVQSASGEVLMPIIGMLGFSLAFALPFTLFAFFPSWLSGLPKSGGWLNSVKVVLGFLELALGLKFLSIADQTYHWGILDREIYLAFWIVIFTLMGFYLLGKLKFSHDSDLPYIGVPRLALAIITFTFVAYMIPGMFGAPLKMLSGYLPPQSSHDFDLPTIIRQNAEMVSTNEADKNYELCEKPRYGEFLHLPHGLKGYFDYEQGMACARKLNKPVFIDFTGHGCVNCREMEANVWSDPRVLKRMRDNFVVIALYVDDKTSLPESEWVVSKYDGKTKKNIGKKYADFQISRFNVNAQPYYVLLDTAGELLNKPRAYDLDVDAFVSFLDEGLAKFNSHRVTKSQSHRVTSEGYHP
ncbi:MAG: disulfide bond formation protein DsbD [Bacteroidetes bacterium]|nr:disulfide bond formation protein DsbD [Bacteroidota bacterium]